MAQSFLEGIRFRDSEERRKLCYGNRAISVAFDLIHVIYAHNSRLLESLRVAGTDHNAVARAFLAFAPAEKYVTLARSEPREAVHARGG